MKFISLFLCIFHNYCYLLTSYAKYVVSNKTPKDKAILDRRTLKLQPYRECIITCSPSQLPMVTVAKSRLKTRQNSIFTTWNLLYHRSMLSICCLNQHKKRKAFRSKWGQSNKSIW